MNKTQSNPERVQSAVPGGRRRSKVEVGEAWASILISAGVLVVTVCALLPAFCSLEQTMQQTLISQQQLENQVPVIEAVPQEGESGEGGGYALVGHPDRPGWKAKPILLLVSNPKQATTTLTTVFADDLSTATGNATVEEPAPYAVTAHFYGVSATGIATTRLNEPIVFGPGESKYVLVRFFFDDLAQAHIYTPGDPFQVRVIIGFSGGYASTEVGPDSTETRKLIPADLSSLSTTPGTLVSRDLCLLRVQHVEQSYGGPDVLLPEDVGSLCPSPDATSSE